MPPRSSLKFLVLFALLALSPLCAGAAEPPAGPAPEAEGAGEAAQPPGAEAAAPDLPEAVGEPAPPAPPDPFLPLWTIELPDRPAGAPVPLGPRVHQPLEGGGLASADAATGEGAEVVDVGEGFAFGAVALGWRLAWAEPGGVVVVYDPDARRALARWELGGEVTAPLATHAGRLLVATGSELHLLDPGRPGGPLGSWSFPDAVAAPPHAIGDRLFVPLAAGEAGAVWVLDPGRPGRRPIRTFPTPGRPHTPAARDGRLFVADESGALTAWRYRGGLGRGARRLWRRQAAGAYLAPPLLEAAGLVAVSLDHWLVYLGPADGFPHRRVHLARRPTRPFAVWRDRAVLSLDASTGVTVVGLREGAASGTLHLRDEDAQVLTPPAVDAQGRAYASFGPYSYRLSAFALEPR
jgi:hypothetical protein